MVQTMEHVRVGPVSIVGSPLKLSRTPVVAPTAPPVLGQHTEEVLSALKARGEP